MSLKMQNTFFWERIRIFGGKKTFFWNLELTLFYQIWLVFCQWDMIYHGYGTESMHGIPSHDHPAIKLNLAWCVRKKHWFFSMFDNIEIFFVNWVASMFQVDVTAGVTWIGGKKLNNIIRPWALIAIRKPIKDKNLWSDFTLVTIWGGEFCNDFYRMWGRFWAVFTKYSSLDELNWYKSWIVMY